MKNSKNRLHNKSNTSEPSLSDWGSLANDWDIKLPDWNIELPNWDMPDLPLLKDILEPIKGVSMIERNKKRKRQRKNA